ncbi:hypothetical protein [Halomarina pelagica]|uniref:hypothetical protein n=1 Tax=Halomarina pelagica TaxID=2961599 RepID=UPI0020C2DC59|nr:hypothetical protein [Halomarina sp. BND7]
MADPVAVKRALARLAAPTDHDRTVVERAVAAREDIERAATFVESVGLPRLRRAVARTPGEEREGFEERGERGERGERDGRERRDGRAERDPTVAREGRAALRAFERCRAAARGDHFRPGHATDLGPDTKRGDR